MNSERKELFRLAILRVLDEQRTRFGLGIVALAFHLRKFGFTAADFGDEGKFFEAIADDLEYLTNKNFVEEVLKQVSKENRAWRITKAGIAFVDTNP
jgi:hypothetical protein